ncbi:MAG: phospholipase D-like domain-containing protein [Candidatus Kapaibacterium sp.]
MKGFVYTINVFILLLFTHSGLCSNPIISDVKYSEIETYSVKITWKTSEPADSRVRWMISDSNYQAIDYKDSLYNPVLDTVHSITIPYLNPYTLYNYNITSVSTSGSTTTHNLMFATRSVNDGRISVFFNKSVDTTVSSGIIAEGNADLRAKLLNRIVTSGYFIDAVTSYFEDADEITAELIRAHKNGVIIRFIYDGKQNSRWVDTLIANGIKVVKRNYDNINGHCLNANFWVFDARSTCSGSNVFVWTSSADISNVGFYEDKNSAVEINDRTLAYIFTREIDEMWGSYSNYPDTTLSKFGSRKVDNIPHLVNLNGVYAEVYFGPSDSIQKQIKKFFNNSNSSLAFGTYDFNSHGIYEALYQLRLNRNIKGIFDKSKLNVSFFNSMKSWADVWNDSTEGRLHHKYIISDPIGNYNTSSVLMGSSDWTNESNLYNDENILIIHSPLIANQYYQEFHQRYKDASGHPVSINTLSSETPLDFKLYQNYPNPFNSQTVIRFSVNKSAVVSIQVYNVLGQKITDLINSRFNPGEYQVTFKSSSLSTGIYYYTMWSEGYSDVKKLVITK